MAAPNLRNPSTITGKTFPYACTDALASVIANGAASNKLLKVNTIRAANITGSAASIDIAFRRDSTDTYVIKSADVPPKGALVILDKDEYIYLEEGDAIFAKAGANATVELTLHYEEVT